MLECMKERTTTTITTTLSPDNLRWITAEAAAEGTTRRAILERAIDLYRRQQRQEDLAESYRRFRKE
jgi:hypothetical protein